MPWRYSWRKAALPTPGPICRCISLMLPPEENTLPAAVRISTRTAGSRSMRANAASSWSTMPLPVSALRVAGSSSVSVTTPSALCS
ncbi:hypothetical protein G6F63_015360 [Rhizopus arrhizus]|nr:hypothetical protein G6F63_015360 [Rhizopus arrhizus]